MVQARSNPPPLDAASSARPSPQTPQHEATWAEPNWDLLTEEWDSDEPTLESDFHRDNIDLLVRLLKWAWRDRPNFYVSGNTTVYFDESQRTNRNFRGPDFYVCLGAEKRDRKSWMTWREGGKYPNIVIELLSPSTAKVDRTTKKTLYQDTWRLPEYFWFSPKTLEFKGFQLQDGGYVEIHPNEREQRWSQELQLFLGIHDNMLRFFTPDGEMVLQKSEEMEQRAEQAIQRAEQETQRAEQASQKAEQESQRAKQVLQQAEQESQRAERLAAKLRAMGIDPETIE